MSGLEAVRKAVLIHRRKHLPDSVLVDFGPRDAYLECITTYAHGTAGHTALQAWALRETHSWLDEATQNEASAEADRLEAAALGLYREGEGFFNCRHPEGVQHAAPNLYDISLVLLALGERLPVSMRREIVAFVREQMLTPTWAHCLWPGDFDVASGIRCDHQWAGCFGGWPPQFVLGLMRAGEGQSWLVEWLEGVAQVTRQGPFAQAYWAEDVYPSEAGAAAKCFDELTQGNHWVIGSGVLFAEMILDGVCGLRAGHDGLSLEPGLEPWASSSTLTGIACQGRSYELSEGKLLLMDATQA